MLQRFFLQLAFSGSFFDFSQARRRDSIPPTDDRFIFIVHLQNLRQEFGALLPRRKGSVDFRSGGTDESGGYRSENFSSRNGKTSRPPFFPMAAISAAAAPTL